MYLQNESDASEPSTTLQMSPDKLDQGINNKILLYYYKIDRLYNAFFLSFTWDHKVFPSMLELWIPL